MTRGTCGVADPLFFLVFFFFFFFFLTWQVKDGTLASFMHLRLEKKSHVPISSMGCLVLILDEGWSIKIYSSATNC